MEPIVTTSTVSLGIEPCMYEIQLPCFLGFYVIHKSHNSSIFISTCIV